ncbi:MAG: small ribosomal subunit Rsm22 family protein [Opitutaceae bacterium]|nr:small ribosomal subunit Rsm22 family protein [Opitutaceae bacterium]
MNWDKVDWEALERLRENFLSESATPGPYWHSLTDLECYDFTFGQRIGWKWDAVLCELRQRHWNPPAGVLLDWGCGSGIAGRRVADFYGADKFERLLVWDHSSLACDYAAHHARLAFPGLAVDQASYRFLQENSPIGLLLISHVLNELTACARAELETLAARAQSIIWVEPGTHVASRTLVGWREKLIDRFSLIAPCTHQAACGLLTPANERHWCHHFANPPPGIFSDSHWVKFGQRMGIDLRSLPYSFLALDRQAGVKTAPGASRILGEPRFYKGFVRIFNCDADGISELTMQKRTDPDLFKSLKRARGPLLYHWQREGNRITAIERPTY